ncbi:site-2 protease family protein [Planctomycetes bacterium Poly30]|uniref:site-2 protease family protein n=1 Tax=Saltatorellus ferox TaxID=2528018 RepID=UPI0011A96E72
MLENHTIARIAGIPIRANLALGYMLALWAVWGAANGHAGSTAVLIVLSTALLIAHELGHAFVARHFRLDVIDIILWPLGGMARISNMPEDPKVEGWVAAAGPLVNLALALVAAPLLMVVSPGPDAPLVRGTNIAVGENLHGIVLLFVIINVAYGLFNLLPAFPMDGGRLLRAFLARGGRSWVAATEKATSVGSVIAWTIIVLSLFKGACFLSLIGFFILWAGLRERWSVRLKHQVESMGGSAGRFAGWEHLMRQRAGGAAAAGPTAFDAPPDAAAFDEEPPVPKGGGQGLHKGFSEEDIERLESFRGRLKKPGPE